MPSLIDIRRRVRAVKSTQQITKAMKMVSSSKLRRAQERIVKSRPYAKEMLRVFNNLATRTENATHPLLNDDPRVGAHAADRDHRRSRPVRQLQHQRRQGGAAVHARAAQGIRRAATWRWRWSAARAATSSCAAVSTCSTKRSASSRTSSGRTRRRSRRPAIKEFLGPDISSVYLVYNEFRSVISQRVVIEKLLPIPRLNEAEGSRRPGASGGARTVGLPVRARSGAAARHAAAAARGRAGAARAARVIGGRTCRAHAVDGQRDAQREGNGRSPHPLHEQGATGGDHARNYRSRVGSAGNIGRLDL